MPNQFERLDELNKKVGLLWDERLEKEKMFLDRIEKIEVAARITLRSIVELEGDFSMLKESHEDHRGIRDVLRMALERINELEANVLAHDKSLCNKAKKSNLNNIATRVTRLENATYDP